MERRFLAPGYEISRIIRGNWQLAGGHGAVDRAAAVDDLLATAEAGITTFDCADIYTGVEEIIGRFRLAYGERYGTAALRAIRVHTKCVPDLALLPRLRKSDIETIIDTSLKRLHMERLDLVQFHWWDCDVPGALDAASWLTELQQAGKIDRVSATNFNTDHVEALFNRGTVLTSMQVQYSLIDKRPAGAMTAAAQRLGFKLLCYGTVAGGFLSDRWLGQGEPRGELENRSLTKYKLIIDDIGGWDLHQDLLAVLRSVADRHGVDIATVASRHVLDLPEVAGVIVGARNRDHLAANIDIDRLRLTDEDRAAIKAVTDRQRPLSGDVYDLERDRTGRHGAIMKYNLNAGAA